MASVERNGFQRVVPRLPPRCRTRHAIGVQSSVSSSAISYPIRPYPSIAPVRPARVILFIRHLFSHPHIHRGRSCPTDRTGSPSFRTLVASRPRTRNSILRREQTRTQTRQPQTRASAHRRRTLVQRWRCIVCPIYAQASQCNIWEHLKRGRHCM